MQYYLIYLLWENLEKVLLRYKILAVPYNLHGCLQIKWPSVLVCYPDMLPNEGKQIRNLEL